MLGGLFFLAAAGAIVVAILWSIQNDRAGLFDKTRGLLAMDDDYERSERGRTKPNRNSRSNRRRPARRSRDG